MLCLISYFQLARAQQLGLPFAKFIGSSEYNAGMQNSAIVQDKRGFMYFANNFGLLEFDGSRWQTYPVKDGSKVRDLAIAANGQIYIAAQGEFGYFSTDERGNLNYNSLSNLLPETSKVFDEVWKVFIGKNETYFCASNHIFVYSNNLLVDIIEIGSSRYFFYLNNRLYFQVENDGIFYLLNRNKAKLNTGNNFSQLGVVSILPSIDDQLLFITSEKGIYNLDGKLSINPFNNNNLLAGLTINTVLRLSNGNIAFGTQNSGLYIYTEQGELVYHLSKEMGLNDRVVRTLLEDKHSNLWLGHNNGLSIVELGIPFSYINEANGLPGSGYNAYATMEKIYFATSNGLYSSNLSAKEFLIQSIENTSGQNYSIKELNGKLLIGKHDGAYEITRNGSALQLNETSGEGTWLFKRSNKDSQKLISGTYNGLELYTITERGINFEKKIYGFDESARVMEFDEFGDLWMTHGYKGVYRLTLNQRQDSVIKVQFYGENEGLPNLALVNVYKIENELLFTTPDGLYVFDYSSNRFAREELLSQTTGIGGPLNFLAIDPRQNIYFLAQNQMGMGEKLSDGSYTMNVDLFNKVAPLLNDDLPNISIINTSNILFGAREGFIVYNPIADFNSDYQYNTYIRNVSVTSGVDSLLFAGNFVDSSRIVSYQPVNYQPTLPYNRNSIQFMFSATYMNDFSHTTYQHQLEGFDDSWSAWKPQIIQNYTNLDEGEYIFHVRAKNMYNVISSEATYRFTILPPWYRSSLAYISYSILFMTSFIMGFIFIDRKYTRSKKDYVEKKQQEVDDIDLKLKSLTLETSEEIDKLKSDKLQSEVDNKNTELASSTMNLINKNKFIELIKINLATILKKSTSTEVKKELTRIGKEIDKNISNDDDWKQFSFHFNSVHGDFTTRLTNEFNNLSGQDLRLCSYLRLNLSTKEIAQLLNISVRGVEISRYRLRKKLKLERSNNLSEFILNY